MIFYFACISKDVFIHPVPVQVIIRITFILFLPFIGDKTRFEFFAFIQIEVGINISSKLQILVEFDFKELEEVSLIRISKVGGIIDLRNRVLLTVKHSDQRAIRIISIEIRTTSQHCAQ